MRRTESRNAIGRGWEGGRKERDEVVNKVIYRTEVKLRITNETHLFTLF